MRVFRLWVFVLSALWWMFRGQFGAAAVWTVGIFFLPLLDDRREG